MPQPDLSSRSRRQQRLYPGVDMHSAPSRMLTSTKLSTAITIVSFNYLITDWTLYAIPKTHLVLQAAFYNPDNHVTAVAFRGHLLPFCAPEFISTFFILKVYQIVNLSTPNMFAVSLMGLFGFFHLMMACYTGSYYLS